MSQDNTQPDATGTNGKDAGAAVPPDTPSREPNGTPVDLGSHNPDPHAHEWLHPEADLDTWDTAFDTAKSAADGVATGAAEGDGTDDDGTDDSGASGIGDDGAAAADDGGASGSGDGADDGGASGSGDGGDGDGGDGDPPGDYPPGDYPRGDAVPPAKPENTTRQRWLIGGIVVVVMALMAVGIWFLVNMLSNSPEQSADGQATPGQSASAQPLPHDVNALEFQQGDCFADFDSEANSAMAVACDTPHSAQLVAVHRYAAEDSYPGRDTLKAKAQEACKGAQLTPKSNEYALKFQLVYPSPTSWDKGDRRVDCFIVVDNGNTIKENLVK